MMDFKTSKKLRDQNFPQPEVAEGQNWFTESGLEVAVAEWQRGNEFLIFRPTTADLIEQIVKRIPEISIGKQNGWHVRIRSEAVMGDTLDEALVLFWEIYLKSER